MTPPVRVLAGPAAWVGGGFVLTMAFFWPSLASLPPAWAVEGSSHGWAIAMLTAWLIWRHRHELSTDGPGEPTMLLPVAGFSLLWLGGVVSSVQALHLFAFVGVLTCWTVAVLGRSSARVTLSIAATFLLAVPMWGVLVPVLRPLTVVASGAMLWLLRIPASIDGDFITIQSGTFLVEDGCAGLNYLMAGLVLGAFYAHLFLGHWRTRLAVLGIAAAIAIAGNWIRVTVLVVIGHVAGMQSSLIEDHLWMGWVIFTAGLIPFFLLARRMERRDVGRGTSTRRPPPDTAAPGASGRGKGGGTPLRRVVTASAVAAAGPALYFGVGALPAASGLETDLSDLAGAGDWIEVGEPHERPFTWQPGYQGAHEHLTATFTDGSVHVYADRLLYDGQVQGAELIGHLNRIADDRAVIREGVGRLPAGRWLRQAIVHTPETPILVWYWFRVGDVDTISPLGAKLLEVRAFFERSRTSGLTALSTPCAPDDCADALATLSAFMGVVP